MPHDTRPSQPARGEAAQGISPQMYLMAPLPEDKPNSSEHTYVRKRTTGQIDFGIEFFVGGIFPS